jgi:2-polyprenyl-3-methyl-5-hydroxy-6-metoxy-1,4-benzoquinol methylase
MVSNAEFDAAGIAESPPIQARGMHPAGEWVIHGIETAAARAFLKRHEPWRMELKFDCGPKASDGKTFEPFNPAPLNKLRILMEHIPDKIFAGARVLDVGFNAGYNSLYLAQNFNALVTGIDISEKHKSVADELAEMLGLRAEFIIASAEEFERRNAFDIVLHLGTLYHLANPVRSLERSMRSLRKNGWFALETICYRASPDPAACKWIRGFAGDRTNFWALGEAAILSIAQSCEIADLRMILEVWPDAYKREMSRTIWIGQKST